MENTQILTKIGNKIYQICKVVMLPTEKSSIHLVLDKELILCDKPVNKSSQHQPQHIYVLSDDKIKDTEYGFCMNLFRKGYTPRQIMFVMNTEQREAMIDLGGQIKAEVKKIIATTNEYLSINNFDDVNRIEDIEIHLPQPSQSFIKYFIEEYNKGNLIQEVLVEYDIKDTGTEQDNDGIKSHTSTNGETFLMGYINRPKLNPKDNTVITKEIKHNYSREYVIKLLRSQADFIDDLYRPYHRNNTLGFDSCDKFIEQNL